MSDSQDQGDPSGDFGAQLDGFPAPSEQAHVSRLPIEVLVSQYVDECRAGMEPDIEDYASRYPDLADDIREFFPLLTAMEDWKGEREASSLRKHIPHDFAIERLGDCKIVRELGRGGMGVVFEAIEDGGRRVAVKLMPWKGDTVPRWKERFEQEARMAARLRHRHIVPIYRYSKYQGYCYYVMKMIDGVSLDRIIERLKQTEGVVYADEIRQIQADTETSVTSANEDGKSNDAPKIRDPRRRLRRQSWTMFARLGVQAATALQHAHNEGLLHNDIKPGNILLDAAGEVWVTDFGLARPLEPDASDTPARLAGTLRYIAPERFLGQCDGQSDVYSLGASLYELVTLTSLFPAANPNELQRQILEDEPVRPRRLNSQVPRDLETILLKATEKHPPQRYQSAKELADDLSLFTKGKRIKARRPSSVGHVMNLWRGWVRRRTGDS